MNDVPSKDRDIAMVFQNYALYPHMTVGQNIGFALKLRKVPRQQIEKKVREAAAILHLTDQLDRKPGQLSGGQRQRVAMGRAIVRDPSVFLMDEPLSNLDAKLRVEMRAEVLRLQRRIGVATIYVTHDQTEAMTMGDRVAVMRSGILQQCDASQTLYDHPANLFVASFIGSPSMNIYEAVLSSDGERIFLGSQFLDLSTDIKNSRPGLAKYRGRKLAIGIRPEHLMISRSSEVTANRLKGEVEIVEALGSELLVYFRLDAVNLPVAPRAMGSEEKEDLVGSLDEIKSLVGVARLPPRLPVRMGDKVEFEVAIAYLHFFDLESGLAITV